jgi:hypothetical protein
MGVCGALLRGLDAKGRLFQRLIQILAIVSQFSGIIRNFAGDFVYSHYGRLIISYHLDVGSMQTTIPKESSFRDEHVPRIGLFVAEDLNSMYLV